MSNKDELLEMAKRILEDNQDTARVLRAGKIYRCSSCNGEVPQNANYCPDCGKRLDWSYSGDNIYPEKVLIYGGVNYHIVDMSIECCDGYPNELKIVASESQPELKWPTLKEIKKDLEGGEI